MKKLVLSVLSACIVSMAAFSQTFVNINADIIDVYLTITTSGDFDNDSDIDFFLAGQLASGLDESVLYINEGNDIFTPSSGTNFPPLEIGAAECADFNNDSFLDIVIQGLNGGSNYTKIWQNNGDGTFTELSAGLPQTFMGDVSCVDFNNDSYIDIAISGLDASYINISKIFANNGDGTFTEVPGTNFPACNFGKFKWADYNNDGFQDFILTGWGVTYVTEIFKNNGDGTFSNSGISIHQGWLGDVEWADYNNDGNIDLVVSGTGGNGAERFTIIYKNNGDETFTELSADLPGVSHGALEWADFDGNNTLDLLICGTVSDPGSGEYISSIFLNNGDDTFTESLTAQLPGIHYGDSEVADFNNDGMPDILLAGTDTNEAPYSAIFINETQILEYSVTFRVDMSALQVSPDGIHIAGNFQGWEPGATLMTDVGNSIYEYSWNFEEGEMIEYKFINGTEWDDSENVPEECGVPDGSGGFNRYVIVPDIDTTLISVCFSSCTPCITGFENNKTESKITAIYPNPFTDKIYVEYYLTGKVQTDISVYNSYGEKVFKTTNLETNGGINIETVSLTNLAGGVYFVILKVNGVIIQTEKVVK